MHYRTPIVTSDLDFAHEICGASALYFDPSDVQDMCEKILQVGENVDAMRKNCAKQILKVSGDWKSAGQKLASEIVSISL